MKKIAMISLFDARFVAACLMSAVAIGQVTVGEGPNTGSPSNGALGISGDRFTINGQPTFLLGASYFDALGWSNADLDALQARRFNLARIFLDWSIIAIPNERPMPGESRGFINSDGSLKNTEKLLNLIRACAARRIMVDVTILNAIYDGAKPLSKTLDMQSRENAVRNAVRLLKNEPNVFFDVCNEHDVAWNGKTTTLTHAEVAALIRAALAEQPGAILTVSSGGGHLPNVRNTREELDAGVMLVSPHFQRTSDWHDRTEDRVKSVKEDIGSTGRIAPVYLQEEQRRGWAKTNSPPKAEFLQAAREAVSSGAAGWVFHTNAGFDMRAKSFYGNLDPVEREVVDGLGEVVFGSKRNMASGPLRKHPTNDRYFTDGSGMAIYLTGSHTWANLQDCGLTVGSPTIATDPPPVFDYDAYLDLLQANNHNFMRLWKIDLPKHIYSNGTWFVSPHPWLRSGPGKANDGKPKFDLKQFDQSYFDRLRSRVNAARNRGIYVGIMLFDGWYLRGAPTSWQYHPFRSSNNVNGVNGDANGNGQGEETNTLQVQAVVDLQKAYVRKVIDTVNDLDNVLYEIANESAVSGSTQWQYELINYIKSYQAGKPKQHPIGMTSPSWSLMADHNLLWNSPADWISLGGEPYISKPTAAPGGKVSILDTDHLGWDVYVNDAIFSRTWVWKSFLRGHNPILMEDLKNNSGWIAARAAMGHTRTYANKMNLAAMTPQNGLSETSYCLANSGQEYLVYQAGSGAFSVNLTAGTYAFEWFNPATGAVASTGSVKAAGGNQTFTPPFSGLAVLYLKVASAEPEAASSTTSAPKLESSAKQMTNDRPEKHIVRVAAVQAQGRVIDWRITDPAEVLAVVDKNLAELERIVERAGRENCDALALPEDTLGLLHWLGVNEAAQREVLPAAVTRMLDRLGSAAAKHRMYLVVCSDHIEADGGTYNTAFLLGRDGREIGRYHKTCPSWPEWGVRQRGSNFPVFNTPDLGMVGMLICYDLVMPETARCLALQGTDIIFFPTMGGAAIGDDDIGVQALRVRAAENFVYLVVAHRGSGSMIISPQGKIISQAEGPDGIAIADIDPRAGREGGDSSNHQHDMRARLFRERNPASFSLLTDPNPPVLAKVPIAIKKEDAGRILSRMLTVGEEEFKAAAALARVGLTHEAIRALNRLRKEYPGTWIDRESQERLANLQP